MPTPGGPYDMEGILAELERLRGEVEELRSDRDHWMNLWQRVTTELLRRTPPSTIQLPGVDAQTAAVLNILDLGMQDVAAGRVESFEEVRRRITGASRKAGEPLSPGDPGVQE